MAEILVTISTVISEHHTTREHTRLAGDSISDEEAITTLKATSRDWIPGRRGGPEKRQMKLLQRLNFVEEGLKNHFATEETVLAMLLGELLTRAIILDHRNIVEKIHKARSIVADMVLQGLSREELLTKESQILQLIDHICHLIEDHATKEDIVLDMMERALQDEQV
jgi:hypothetical protein